MVRFLCDFYYSLEASILVPAYRSVRSSRSRRLPSLSLPRVRRIRPTAAAGSGSASAKLASPGEKQKLIKIDNY